VNSNERPIMAANNTGHETRGIRFMRLECSAG
jgi:hypothetical protein